MEHRAACRDVSQGAVHSLLPTIHSCSSSVNSQRAEKGNTAICKSRGKEAPGAEFRFSGVRRDRQRCCMTEQAGWRMKEAVERLSKPWANTFPLPLWQRGIAARTRSEDLMPADVIWTDTGSGTGQRQPLRSWERTGGRAGRQHWQERSRPHRSGPSPLARVAGSSSIFTLSLHITPSFTSSRSPQALGSLLPAPKTPVPNHAVVFMPSGATRGLVRHNSPLSPPDDSPFHQPVVFHHR